MASRKKRKLRPWVVYALFILLALLIAGGFIFYNVTYNKKVDDKTNHYVSFSIEEKPMALPETIVEEGSTPFDYFLDSCGNREKYEPYLTDMFPDFDTMLSENPDTIGYICIPGTNISYPVMQNEDNNYYLHHNFDGSRGYPGCIYMETENSALFTDQVTILYGHNMKSGAMFRGLHNYTDLDYMKENPYVIIYTPSGISIYEIFLASNYSDDHLFNSNFVYFGNGDYGFSGFRDNQNEITISNIMKYNASTLTIDQDSYDYTSDLLVLSTCDRGNKRLVVVAKKVY